MSLCEVSLVLCLWEVAHKLHHEQLQSQQAQSIRSAVVKAITSQTGQNEVSEDALTFI